MENNELILAINKELALELPEKVTHDELHRLLAARLNDLIKNDFEKLVACLYRIDVSEAKLKSMLQQEPQENAANIMASLIIERQQQKIKTRREFSGGKGDIKEEEKW